MGGYGRRKDILRVSVHGQGESHMGHAVTQAHLGHLNVNLQGLVLLRLRSGDNKNMSDWHHWRYCPMTDTKIAAKAPFVKVLECNQCGMRRVTMPDFCFLNWIDPLTRFYSSIVIWLKFREWVYWYDAEEY